MKRQRRASVYPGCKGKPLEALLHGGDRIRSTPEQTGVDRQERGREALSKLFVTLIHLEAHQH